MIAIPGLLDGLRAIVPYQVKVYYWAAQGIYTSPLFWGFTASILVLEKLLPADRKQLVFSWGCCRTSCGSISTRCSRSRCCPRSSARSSCSTTPSPETIT